MPTYTVGRRLGRPSVNGNKSKYMYKLEGSTKHLLTADGNAAGTTYISSGGTSTGFYYIGNTGSSYTYYTE